MRIYLLRWAAFALACLMMVMPCGSAVSQEVQWHSYGDGMSRGKFEKKKVFIHFYADWCAVCRQMEKNTFKDPDVVALLNEEYIAIRVNTDREQETAIMFRVRALPDNWFIAEDGEIIGHRPQPIALGQEGVLFQLPHEYLIPSRRPDGRNRTGTGRARELEIGGVAERRFQGRQGQILRQLKVDHKGVGMEHGRLYQRDREGQILNGKHLFDFLHDLVFLRRETAVIGWSSLGE